MRTDVFDFLTRKGTFVQPEAAEYLSKYPDPVAHVRALLGSMRDAPLVLTVQHIQRAESIAREAARSARATRPAARAFPSIGIPASARRRSADAASTETDVRILRDVTGRSTCRGTIADFTRLFRNRFETLGRMLRARREMAGPIEIERAKRLSREVRILGLVVDVRRTRNGHRIVELEDATDRISVLIPHDSGAADDPIVQDEVVGASGVVNDRGLLIARSLVHPDIPVSRTWRGPSDHIRAAFLSDVHMGSKTFLSDRWGALLAWFRSGDEVARSVKYIVVSGDVVDGIGVYPRQDEDLAIDDVYEQYEAVSRSFQELPDRIHVVLAPGNHDAVRPAEPQPALPSAVQKVFDSNVTFAGNPCAFTLHGVRVLSYHGRSMDDFVTAVPGLSYARPLDAMQQMLRKRHLAPIYGGKTPIAPESEDYLIIDEVPDVFATGHVHAAAVDRYRGVVTVNSSTWQAQTSYQKMHNIDPMPAQLPLVDLATGEFVLKPF